jgi:hypothetical protein
MEMDDSNTLRVYYQRGTSFETFLTIENTALIQAAKNQWVLFFLFQSETAGKFHLSWN